MGILTIQYSDSLDTVWSELTYTEARLLKSKDAKDLATPIAALLKRLDKLHAGQRAAWRAEITAQAGVDDESDQLGDAVDSVSDELLRAEGKDRSSPRYKRYFKKPPNKVIRLGLESELGLVRHWPASLQGEPESSLQTLGKHLEAQVTAGDAAITERNAAASATADQRVRDINAFVDDVNASRRSLQGALITRGEQKKLAKDWAERFFRASTHKTKATKKDGVAGQTTTTTTTTDTPTATTATTDAVGGSEKKK